ENYSAIRGLFPHFYRSRNAADAGHYYIHNHGVRVDPRKPVQGGMPAGKPKPVDTLFFQDLKDRVSHNRLVVNHHHGKLLHTLNEKDELRFKPQPMQVWIRARIRKIPSNFFPAEHCCGPASNLCVSERYSWT